MTNPTLRKKISLLMAQAYIGDAVPGYNINHDIDQILQAVSEYIEELLGEDEEPGLDDYKVTWNAGRNELRQELREKLKKDFNGKL